MSEPRALTPPTRIAILGDPVAGYAKHDAIAPALERAARALGVPLETRWIPSERLSTDAAAALDGTHGALAAPQSVEYCRDIDAVIEAVSLARETGLACLAVCGGAQLALRGFARTLKDPGLADRIVGPAGCGIAPSGDSGYALTGLREVQLAPATLCAEAYGGRRAREPFECDNVLDPAAEAPLREAGVRIAATTPGIGPTIFEWPDHPFFVATLFLPQWSPRQPHPLLTALMAVARART